MKIISFSQTLLVASIAYGVTDGATTRRSAQLTQGSTWTLEAWGPPDSYTNGKTDMIDVDFMTKSKSYIESLVKGGQTVVCYISAGTAEEWRPDYLALEEYCSSDSGYSRECWLDITKWKSWRHLMKNRLESAQEKGCMGIEPDNTDSHSHDSVPGKTKKEMTTYMVEYVKWLAEETHNLGMIIGLKNTLDLIPELVDHVDFAINESCQKYAKYDECALYEPFVEQNKAVFAVEWSTEGDCSDAAKMGLARKYERNGEWIDC
ncbi:hypothetical protein SARC_11574 [Sphaeroforma arctica JP610]|uniref:Glycoside-hydrolase family GH114 TIM-barrel domain-containing protein n=1 Tax=Sphaeroforma arctica JP610 TaxID=667725 RepID=A0A0L0FGJ9_9EUKA|nr:hypothetical protein SARC_11574 [Sphaeroforma arctica JP610]KNC75909.1 hypothetical protein SARC_11574 [Sphaeroforma arctica JP610]|eukprot:XP_014149811.1 hypothetical protein SARC_11574 [Sphaeroforma arctica JP610]